MPALVNYGGDDEYYPGGSFYPSPMDLDGLLPTSSHVDLYFRPSKRARIGAPVVFGGRELELESSRPSIEALPDECLFEIFRHLHSARERSSCAGVSRRWLMLLSTIRKAEICKEQQKPESDDISIMNGDDDQEVESNGFLTRCLEGKKATDVRLAAIAVGTSGRGGLGKLSIRGSNSTRGVTNLGLSAIAHGCPSLRMLSLWNVPAVGDEGLFEIARECHLLEKLDLCHCPSISDKGLIAIAERCTNLTSLNIESCPKIGNDGLQAIGKLCSKLQAISIRDCPRVGDQGVSSLFASSSCDMTKVKMQALNITDFSLAVIGHYGQAITHLTLSGLQNVSEKGFWVMGSAQGLKKLASLTIASCRGMTDVSLEAMGKGIGNLKQMCIQKCCFVSDNGLTAFAQAARSLETLQLEECNRITLLGIGGALSNHIPNLKSLNLVKCMGIKDIAQEVTLPSICTSLRSLSIQNCPGFGSASLSMVGSLCPQLQHVELIGLYGITDTAMLPLLETCQGLVKVNLSGCINLTDGTISTLVRLHGGTIEVLNLDGCRKITDASLVAIADGCLLLNELDVSKCAISDAGLAFLSSSEQINLQVLSLSGCSEVSNKSFPFLERLGKSLVGLNLKNCHSISSGTVGMIVENLWRCDILV
ncbi:EIN3-binding F-box protein 1-like [Momordica charantia]|uniref:EIN3-binding F-box protein 1-like n=1 Tax=Momordica charantia TaxID=3673 RepID=A0A6J1CNG4_MOMCH|nr:EIN3-binding F-box protein 1-like [Momordica charantia]